MLVMSKGEYLNELIFRCRKNLQLRDLFLRLHIIPVIYSFCLPIRSVVLITKLHKNVGEIYMETVNLEDVRAILQIHEGATLYPIMISNIIREIRKRDLEQKNKMKLI